MDVQHIPGDEPLKVRTRKPKPRDPAVDQEVVAHGQPPPIRESNRALPQQHQHQQLQQAGNWDGYGNADAAGAYTEHYNYDDREYVDPHGYGNAHQGYAYGNEGQAYGYRDAAQGYDNGDQGYNFGDQGYNYGDQGYDNGDVAGQEHVYAAPTQLTATGKPKKKKAKKPKPAADQHQHQGDGFAQPVRGSGEGSFGNQQQQHQVDAHGQPVQDRYAYPEAYTGADPDPIAHGHPKKLKEKGRKQKKESQSSNDVPVPVKGSPNVESGGRVQGEHDGDAGRTSQEGLAPTRTKSSDREGSGSSRAKPHRSNSEQRRASSKERVDSEGRVVDTRPEVKPPPMHGNPGDALSVHVRKMAKPRLANTDMSMVVFHDPNDRTLIDAREDAPPQGAPSRNLLDDWVKQQSELSGGNRFNQHESLIVMPDDNKEALETQMFGAPLPKKQQQLMKLPPLGETTDRPQYQPRGGMNNRHHHHHYPPVVEAPLHQPVQRRGYANDHQMLPYDEHQAHGDAGEMEVYDPQGKQIKPSEPNAKCMACVHGIGVPVARVVTRIACVQCQRFCQSGCTIL